MIRRIVIASGWWNIGVGVGVLVVFQGVSDGVREGMGLVGGEGGVGWFWTLMLCGVLWLAGVVLVLGGRELGTRGRWGGVIVYYEGLARVLAGVLLLTLGRAELGWVAVVIGVADLGFGLVQVVGVPRSLGRTHGEMLRGGGR